MYFLKYESREAWASPLNTNWIFIMHNKIVIYQRIFANNHINREVFSICFVFSFQCFFSSLVLLIFRYSAQIML